MQAVSSSSLRRLVGHCNPDGDLEELDLSSSTRLKALPEWIGSLAGLQKLNLVAQLIRGKKVETALADLTFSRKRIAGDVKKVLQSAIANAENNHDLDVDVHPLVVRSGSGVPGQDQQR